MNPKSKKIMTVGLALSAVGIWIPQLLMGVVDKTPTKRADVANGGGSFEAAIMPEGGGMPMPHEAPDTAFMAEPGMDAAMPGGGEQEVSLPEALSLASKQLEIRNAEERRVDLSDLLNAFRPDEQQQPGREVENLQKELTQVIVEKRNGESQTSTPAITVAEALNQYCSQQTLSAVIWGEHGSIAMINGKVVRDGDVLGHGVQVTSIDRRSVELTYRGETQLIGMPAFETRRPSTNSSASDELSEEPSEEPGTEPGEESILPDPTVGEESNNSADGAPGSESQSSDPSDAGAGSQE